MKQCTIPPKGWICSRQSGHDGPCAAIPMKTEEKLKEKISKILIKWSMPTRQTAINEIVELVENEKKGYVTSFGVGYYNEPISLVFWQDDGTRNKHLTIYYKEVPVGTVPLINQDGVRSFLLAFMGYYISAFGEDTKKELKEYIKSI